MIIKRFLLGGLSRIGWNRVDGGKTISLFSSKAFQYNYDHLRFSFQYFPVFPKTK